jgi:probable rRNA maturation factor
MMPGVMEAKPYEINVRIKRGLKVALSHGWLRGVISKALEADSITEPVELGLVITDNATVRRLNRTYRFKNEPTDVLSFNVGQDNNNEQKVQFVNPPDGIKHLGEVVISYPVAMQQAQEQGHSIQQELALLTVHGILHLLGYDHEKIGEARRMRTREKRIMGILGYSD